VNDNTADLAPLLTNVNHGVVIAQITDLVIAALVHPDHASWRVANLRKHLIGPLTEIRARAGVIAGDHP
jgi:hypothetical protein